ncbi:electron transport complex subunit RsxD [Inmirania thermothiophila]|uniref:Ion-translocating oxidoreductase complex subunit D n=1 Tax=Inmirania thermothiophila TaxID=1750597 RepID=A0A3N1Y8C3_9GAMM|nr:electron transport complex subunit RsxD [Inmirania thermothiophila]ROR35053.1 electron transport complex protein RnfD [Inmirania thermothiophila]
MRFPTPSSPHLHGPASVTRLMGRVLLALVPGAAAATWLYGPGVPVQIALAAVTAVACEAAMLRLRGRPLRPFLTDLSAVLTGVLLALALPPTAPWWIAVVGAAFAIVVAKHLYGGLGYNPFNPAMVGFVVLIIAFPREMTAWPAPTILAPLPLAPGEVLRLIFGGTPPSGLGLDAITMATPLDEVRTALTLDKAVPEVLSGAAYGLLGGAAWQWVALAYLAGGLYLAARRLIAWQIPAGMLGALAGLATVFHLLDPARYAGPLFHLFSGAAMLGAFFIATDPVTASTTPRGRLLFGAGVGAITYVIRTWGGFPDGVAFAVLLMNMAAPTIDQYTRPRVFGEQEG